MSVECTECPECGVFSPTELFESMSEEDAAELFGEPSEHDLATCPACGMAVIVS